MNLEGIVQNGVIVVPCPRPLPDGTKVLLHWQEEGVSPTKSNGPPPSAIPEPSLQDLLLRLAGTVEDLPPDTARNHDHYIHGTRKT